METGRSYVVDAHAYGAVGDGKADDTRALQAALDAAASTAMGKATAPVCYVPPGMYRLEGALDVPPGVTLRGASGGVPHSEHPIGTVLLAYGGRGEADGTPLVTLRPNGVIRNLVIHYPEQSAADVAPYPWSIRVDGELCQVTDVTLTNPYQALDLGTLWNELHTVRNVFACPLKTGVYVDQCTDIGRLENVHFNPNFWTRMALEPQFDRETGQALRRFLEENLIGFKIGKTDWEFISNSFVIFPKYGFHFDDFGHGPGNAVVTQSGSDIGPVAVRVDQVQPHAGVQFANGQFMATVEVGEANTGPVKFTGCGFWGIPATREQVRKQGPSTLALNGCHFTGWDAANAGDPAIRATGGRLIVNGCDFMEADKAQIVLGQGLTSAAIVGNTFRREPGVVNESDGDVQVGLNTVA